MAPPVNSHEQSRTEDQMDQNTKQTSSILKQCLDSTSDTKVSTGPTFDQSTSQSNVDETPDPSWFKAATILLSLKTSAEARLMKRCHNGTSGFSPIWSPGKNGARYHHGNGCDVSGTDTQSNGYHHGNRCDVSGTDTHSNGYQHGNGCYASGTDTQSNSYHHGNDFDEGELNWNGSHISHDKGLAAQDDYTEDDDEIDRDLTTTCSLCHKVYSRPSTLKAHMRIHTGEKPFQCSICNKSFSQDANLKAHLRVHSKEKPFKCQICQRRFAQSSSVTTHMRIHSGERPYKCKVCSRGFADSSTLTKHLRIHTGEKPYQCKVCEMRFSQSGNLSRHMRVHRRKK